MGDLQLQTLTPKAEQALRLYCLGNKIPVISEVLSLSQVHIQHVVKSDLGQGYIKAFMKEIDQHFHNQYSLVVDAIHDGLIDSEIAVRLNAADKWMKAHGLYNPKVDPKDSAEDEVEKELYEVIDAEVEEKDASSEYEKAEDKEDNRVEV